MIKPIHKFNHGNCVTLCHRCKIVICDGLSDDLICPDCVDKLLKLQKLTAQLFDMLESVELSDNETEFHPTVIRSCRVQDTIKLGKIAPEITKILRE